MINVGKHQSQVGGKASIKKLRRGKKRKMIRKRVPLNQMNWILWRRN
jgi:hypothetical protein